MHAYLTSTYDDSGWSFRCTVATKAIPIDTWALHDVKLPDGRSAKIAPLIAWYQVQEEGISPISNYRVPHDYVADFTGGELRGLGLPCISPHRLEIQSDGNIARDTFRFQFRFTDTTGLRVDSLERTGCHLQIGTRHFILANPFFRAVELMTRFNSTPPESREDRFMLLQQLKDSLPEDVINDDFIRRTTIARADAFTLAPSTGSDGKFSFDPVPIRRHEDRDLEMSGDASFSNSLPDAPMAKFKQQFALRGAASSYALGNCYLVLPPLIQKALIVAHRFQKANDERQRHAFFREPRRCLKEALIDIASEDVLDDVFFESQDYSDRVREIGSYEKPIIPYYKPASQTWLPPEFLGIVVKGKLIKLDREDLSEVAQRLQDAISSNTPSITIEGIEVPATNDTLTAIKHILHGNSEDVLSVREQQEKSVSLAADEDPKNTEVNVLQIDRNLDALTFVSRDGRRVNVDKAFIGLKSKPLPHQEKGIHWLQDSFRFGKSGVLLADDMGLGKTFQVLAFLRWLRSIGDAGIDVNTRTLIVAPTGLLSNWQEEHSIHLEGDGLGRLLCLYGIGLRELRAAPPDRGELGSGQRLLDLQKIESVNWVVTTYETLRDYQFSLASTSWGCVVFDEVQKIKNPKALVTDAAKALKSKFTIAITGTPVENSIADLWCISDTAHPGYLGSLRDFVKTYDETDKSSLESLKLRVTSGVPTPLMLRRMKADHLTGLPDKQEVVEKELMPDVQATSYLTETMAARKQKVSRGWMLELLHHMRSISLHPSDRGDESDSEYISKSARLIILFRLLDKFHGDGEKSLVFLESLRMQSVLSEIIQRRYGMGMQPLIINGSVAGSDRQRRVHEFQSRTGFDCMLLSPKAGGVGITLTAARHVVHLSRWWNPAVEDQCTDRVYRIGQQHPVRVYIPIAEHPVLRESSFDNVLHRLIERKRTMSRNLLAPIASNEKELQELFEVSTQQII
jgi:SNF2 family DNA or RNA helicase